MAKKTGYSRSGNEIKGHNKCCNKLAEYEDLEEQGRLLRLPYKVGDTLYRVNKGAKEPVIMMRIIQLYIKQIHKDRTVMRIDAINDTDMGESCYLPCDIGERIFLTREEAEAKLAEWRKAMIEKDISQYLSLEQRARNLFGENYDLENCVEELRQYRRLTDRVKAIYGDQMTLKIMVDAMENVIRDPGYKHPVIARILTCNEAVMWDEYRKNRNAGRMPGSGCEAESQDTGL